MGNNHRPRQFALAARLRHLKGRAGRTAVASARLTEDELGELETAAAGEGKVPSEWAREELLRAARRGPDDPVFTEIVATRMVLNAVFQVLVQGKTMTLDEFVEAISVVRRDKRKIAREVLSPVRPSARGNKLKARSESCAA